MSLPLVHSNVRLALCVNIPLNPSQEEGGETGRVYSVSSVFVSGKQAKLVVTAASKTNQTHLLCTLTNQNPTLPVCPVLPGKQTF